MPKVFISPGHGGSDLGAVGFVIEKDVNLKMAKACAAYLEERNVEVLLSRSEDGNESLDEKIKKCNDFNPQVAVECHNNAGNGNGFEVFHSVVGGTSKTLAKNIEAEVKKIGQNSRGLKTRKGSDGSDYFGMIRLTAAPAVICEGAFVDTKKDAAQIDTKAEQQAFGYAYARGILKTLGIKDKGYPTASPGSSSTAAKPATSIAAKKDPTVTITLPELSEGDSGNSVKAMQNLIEAAGYSVGSAGADGIFGAGTERGLKKYQAKKGLAADGICGTKTWTKLLK